MAIAPQALIKFTKTSDVKVPVVEAIALHPTDSSTWVIF
jgi:hypothetical protein